MLILSISQNQFKCFHFLSRWLIQPSDWLAIVVHVIWLNAHSTSNAVQEFRLKNKAESVGSSKKVEIPPELLCHKCKELVKDAVIIPCCGESLCDECENT